MSSSLVPSKLPHPTRMVFEALRRRPDLRATSRELYEEIHRLYPSRRRAEGEMIKHTTLNGIPTTYRDGPVKEYPDHPISSHNTFKTKVLPYLARNSLIQKYAYSDGKVQSKKHKPDFAWRFTRSYPSPPLLPRDTPLPAPLPSTAESTTFQPIDVDGLLAMPEKWDVNRKITTYSPSERLAHEVGEWKQLNGVFVKNPKAHYNWDLSKRPPLPLREAMAKELKTAVGTRLNKRRQRTRIDKELRFQEWKNGIEEQWAERGPEMIVEQMAKDRIKAEDKRIRAEERALRIEGGEEQGR